MKEVGEGALTHLALKSTLPGSDHVLIRGERGPYVACRAQKVIEEP